MYVLRVWLPSPSVLAFRGFQRLVFRRPVDGLDILNPLRLINRSFLKRRLHAHRPPITYERRGGFDGQAIHLPVEQRPLFTAEADVSLRQHSDSH